MFRFSVESDSWLDRSVGSRDPERSFVTAVEVKSPMVEMWVGEEADEAPWPFVSWESSGSLHVNVTLYSARMANLGYSCRRV